MTLLRLHGWVSRLADLVAPSRCVVCDVPVGGARSACGTCAAELSRGPARRRSLRGVPLVTAGPYAPPLSLAIRRFKYAGRPDLATPLARLLAEALVEGGKLELEIDAVVPVPMHPRRLSDRGYNQAALLAGAVGRLLGLPTVPRALVRARLTRRQATLDRAHRLENAVGSVGVRRARKLAGRRLLIVDDVVTTGATLCACSDAVADAGGRIARFAAVADARADGHAAEPENGHFPLPER